SVLQLSGVTRARDGRLQVRNRIYERVFDREWVTAHMPGAELRRQRAAFRRGAQRVAALSAVVLSVMAGLVVNSVTSARQANVNARLAQRRERDANRYRYVSDMNLARQALDEGDLGRTRALLEAHRPPSGGDEDLRGFEWR